MTKHIISAALVGIAGAAAIISAGICINKKRHEDEEISMCHIDTSNVSFDYNKYPWIAVVKDNGKYDDYYWYQDVKEGQTDYSFSPEGEGMSTDDNYLIVIGDDDGTMLMYRADIWS